MMKPNFAPPITAKSTNAGALSAGTIGVGALNERPAAGRRALTNAAAPAASAPSLIPGIMLSLLIALPAAGCADLSLALRHDADSSVARTAAAPEAPTPGAAPSATPPRRQVAAPPLVAQPLVVAPPPTTVDHTSEPADLWQRLRRGFAMPDLDSKLVAQRQQRYLEQPEYLQRIFKRGVRYLHHIVSELDRRGMPTELALLPMVESAFNPFAHSRSNAMGIWQFVPATGRSYQLEQNWWLDERRDIVASTAAALDYLQRIYDMHGDWRLALASYNMGENAISRLIENNLARGLAAEYTDLDLPRETRHYLPKLQALKNIVADPQRYGVELPDAPNRSYFRIVDIPGRIDVAVAARLANISIEEFLNLNPAYQRPVISKAASGKMLLPVNKVAVFKRNLKRHAAAKLPLSNWRSYKMQRRDTLASVAAKHRISLARLRQINGLARNIAPRQGFRLLVPRPGSKANPDLMARLLPKRLLAHSKIMAAPPSRLGPLRLRAPSYRKAG